MLTKEEKKAASKKRAQQYRKEYYRIYNREIRKAQLVKPQDLMEKNYAQFLCFMQDCLIPSTEDWTRFVYVYDTYIKYCKAIGQKPEFNKKHFGRLMTKCYNKKARNDGLWYGLLVRSKVFVPAEEPPKIEFISTSTEV